MRKGIYFVLLILVTLLVSCKGSDTYRGEWKAMDTEGNKFELIFAEKSFTVTNADGEIATYEYTQNSVKINNSIKTYGIKLADGRSLNILFPIATDESKAVIFSGENVVLYTIGRTDYISYQDIYKLN
ncbi:MAG: hypothetical protein QM660_11895 [Dysgonomonas sp.]